MMLEPGILVRSKAGRDKGHVYVIVRIDDDCIYVADGTARPLCRMKKKNRKHLQPILKMRLKGTPDDEALRKIIKEYTREGETAQCRGEDV